MYSGTQCAGQAQQQRQQSCLPCRQKQGNRGVESNRLAAGPLTGAGEGRGLPSASRPTAATGLDSGRRSALHRYPGLTGLRCSGVWRAQGKAAARTALACVERGAPGSLAPGGCE